MVISSIDLKDGKVVQLKNGKDKVLERDNADELIKDFDKYGETAVIDLDAAQDLDRRKQMKKLLLLKILWNFT